MGRPDTTTTAVSVAVGFGVAAVAGVAAGGLIASGLLVGAASARKGSKPALTPEDIRWDEDGRIRNWYQVLKVVQLGVSQSVAVAAVVCLGLGRDSFQFLGYIQPPLL